MLQSSNRWGVAAKLVTTLHERSRPVFPFEDVREITGLSESSARSFARKLVDRGVAARLKPGLYVLVPFELGRERRYTGNPLLVRCRRKHLFGLTGTSAAFAPV